MHFIKIKIFCSLKDNIKREEKKNKLQAVKIFAIHTDRQDLHPEYIKNACKSMKKKTDDTIFKMRRDSQTKWSIHL